MIEQFLLLQHNHNLSCGLICFKKTALEARCFQSAGCVHGCGLQSSYLTVRLKSQHSHSGRLAWRSLFSHSGLSLTLDRCQRHTLFILPNSIHLQESAEVAFLICRWTMGWAYNRLQTKRDQRAVKLEKMQLMSDVEINPVQLCSKQ